MSQTACPHCGSTNSIETAGQRYCADCGQLITAKKETKAATVKVGKKAEKHKKDEELKPVSHQAPTAKPQRMAPPLNLKAIEQSRKPQASVVKLGVLDLKNTTHKPAAIKKPVGRHVPHVKKAVHQAEVEPVIAKAAITEVSVSSPAQKFSHKQAIVGALDSIMAAKNLSLALAATVIVVISQLVFSSIFTKSGMYAINESIAAGSVNSARATTLIGHFAWASLLGLAGYLVYNYIMAKIAFSSSRRIDGQATSATLTRHHALGSLSGILMTDLLTWLLAAITALLVVGANFGFLGTKSLGVVGVVLAVLVNIIAVYIWLGLIAARQMAIYAIVLAQVGVRRAYVVGWTLYNRQFGRLTAGMIMISFFGLLVSAPVVVLTMLLGSNSALALVLTVAAATLAAAVLMIIGIVYYLQLYGYVIGAEYDKELQDLLHGRKPLKINFGRRMVALGVVSAILMAVMTTLIVNASPVASAIIR